MSTNYVSQGQDEHLRAVGRLRGGGRRIFVASAEVFDGAGNLLAVGECTYRYLPGGGENRRAPD